MRATPMSAATAQACSGPPPPNASSVKSRGSCPRSTDTIRSTLAISASTSATIPAAVRSTSPSSGPLTDATAARARSAWIGNAPSSSARGLSRRSTTLASVTVGRSPLP